METNRKVLLIGGAGYIGSVLTKLLLSKNHQVTVLDNFLYHNHNSLISCSNYENFSIIKGSILNYTLINNLISKNDVIIPLAAIVGAPACENNPELSELVNYEANLNIVNTV